MRQVNETVVLISDQLKANACVENKVLQDSVNSQKFKILFLQAVVYILHNFYYVKFNKKCNVPLKKNMNLTVQ